MGKEVIGIDKFDNPKILRVYNRIKWFIGHGKNVINGKINSKCEIAEEIKLSYGAGLKKLMGKGKQVTEDDKKTHEKLKREKKE